MLRDALGSEPPPYLMARAALAVYWYLCSPVAVAASMEMSYSKFKILVDIALAVLGG